ncbi:hypothetical protein SAMN04488021_10565 [Paracoccus aminovorans]|uniref:Uncharacterized protein n=1 Tax=Paracoccus aminovorans TaxID=34004 RepID=A0A1I2YPH1_9RHOB|nr:SANT/Myb-like DNA-binding domain-containing protein [Paracoccus aminovorans]CQR87455.1 hypothetical protein JCM7685_2915 [Paracoccus aminovorans]SFH27445.1 hypothetical protein SAMN04488021_10565 [Paracoccus aminovorans]
MVRWTGAEDDLLRCGYPDYKQMQASLPHRSLNALRYRCRCLGMTSSRHIWTNREVRCLLELFRRGVSDRDLLASFPGMRLAQLKGKARHVGAERRYRPRPLDDPALDAIRARAFAAGVSLVDLDRRLKTGSYYQSCRRDVKLKPVARAAAFFGGEVTIEWPEEI